MLPKRSFPEILYHYTTQEGLLGILKEKALWITNLYYLNDSSEYLHAFDLAEKEIKNNIAVLSKNKSGKEKDIQNYLVLRNDAEYIKTKLNIERLNKLVDLIPEINNDIRIFVCSFSEKSDHLGQWRGYCQNESGYCIGFDSKKLASLSNEQGLTLECCIYKKKEKNDLIEMRVKTLIDNLSRSGAAEAKFLENLIEVAPTIKRAAFRDEAEWRIIRKVISDNELKTFFKRGKSFIVPYTTFNLATKKNKSELPIKSIIIGPTPNPELSKKSIRALLDENQLKDVEVMSSKIPYRNW